MSTDVLLRRKAVEFYWKPHGIAAFQEDWIETGTGTIDEDVRALNDLLNEVYSSNRADPDAEEKAWVLRMGDAEDMAREIAQLRHENELLRARDIEANNALVRLEKVAEAASEAVDCLSCRCHHAYTDRGLRDPKCPCDDLNPLREALAGLNESEEQK